MADIENRSLCFAQIAKGNKEAFDVFFESYYPKLLQFARIFLQSHQQAEDVVADVLTNLLIHRERVFALDHFEAYLYSSVKNKALSSLKKLKKVEPGQDPEVEYRPLETPTSDPHQLMEQREFTDYILQVIENLPPKRKVVFQMIREEGFSYREVADLLEISERTVEVHLKLAVKDLRENIETYLDRKLPGKNNKKFPNLVMPLLFIDFLGF